MVAVYIIYLDALEMATEEEDDDDEARSAASLDPGLDISIAYPEDVRRKKLSEVLYSLYFILYTLYTLFFVPYTLFFVLYSEGGGVLGR
jgi:hypothetical protein